MVSGERFLLKVTNRMLFLLLDNYPKKSEILEISRTKNACFTCFWLSQGHLASTSLADDSIDGSRWLT